MHSGALKLSALKANNVNALSGLSMIFIHMHIVHIRQIIELLDK